MAGTVVFYDGVCGLCNGFVRFLLQRDRHRRLRFASLQSPIAERVLVPRGHDPSDLDTIYVAVNWQLPGEHVLARSSAVLHAVSELGGPWSSLARIARLVPSSVADLLYRVVARSRYRLFGRLSACPMPSPEWRDRFLD